MRRRRPVSHGLCAVSSSESRQMPGSGQEQRHADTVDAHAGGPGSWCAVTRMWYEEPDRAAARFDVGSQNGGTIHNVGGNQYHHYQYHQQRDSLLRDVAATKTRARWLIAFGVVVFLAGFAVFAAGVLGFMTDVADAVTSGNPSSPSTNPFGEPVFGIPSGLIGWACGVIGAVMVILGIVFHVVATARRRRVDREMPPMPPSYR